MKTNSTISRLLLAGCVATLAIGAVSPAFAQSYAPPSGQAYDDQGHYYYDACRRDTNNRAVGGGLLGLAAGAIAGSNLAGRHNRDEGTVVGGVLGALVGSQVGKSTAACAPQYDYAPARIYHRARPGYGYYDGPVYAEPPAAPQPSYYNNGPASYDNSAPSTSNDGCQNVESKIRMPDGRTQTRLVRTCPDSNGRYQIVD
jgi:hypothetical protein